MSIIIRDLSYVHSDKEVLFQHLNLVINPGDKIALTGNNGCGKSTLMRIIAGDLSATTGTVSHPEHLYYVPQHFGQYDDRTIAQALRIDGKLKALHAILNGDVSEKHFTTLNDDWNIEERAQAALSAWGMDGIPLSHLMGGLSGEKKHVSFLPAWNCTHLSLFCWMSQQTIWMQQDGNGYMISYGALRPLYLLSAMTVPY